MDALTTLLTQFSGGTLFLVLVTVAVAIKFLSDLLEWFYKKLKTYFNVKDEKEERHQEILSEIRKIQEENKHFEDLMAAQDRRLDALEKQSQILIERMQDSTRAYIMDKHHYFCYQIKAIDDMSLQDLERRFVYYKSAGGDTFIDGMMTDLRELPRITIEQISKNQIQTLKDEMGGKY